MAKYIKTRDNKIGVVVDIMEDNIAVVWEEYWLDKTGRYETEHTEVDYIPFKGCFIDVSLDVIRSINV